MPVFFHVLDQDPQPSCLKPKAYSLRPDDSGFTLLEVMVSMAILAIALGAVLSFQGRTVVMAAQCRFDTTAPFLAEKKMAELMGADKESLAPDAGDFGEEYPGYTWKTEIEEVESEVLTQADMNLRKIHLAVAWGDGGDYVYEITTLRFLMAPLKES